MCGCYGWPCLDGFLNRLPTVPTATSASISSIPITIIGMPTTYSAVVPIARRRRLGTGISSEYGCQADRDVLEVWKSRSDYQTQAGDEET